MSKVVPQLNQDSTREFNLTVLQRIDAHIEEILSTAAHVTFYQFNLDRSEWSRKDVEGSLFVVKRRTQPRFQFIVMNRRSTENLVEDLLSDFEYEVQLPYLLYRNGAQEVNGIWFYNQRDCEDVANLFSRILTAYKVSTKTKTFPSKRVDNLIAIWRKRWDWFHRPIHTVAHLLHSLWKDPHSWNSWGLVMGWTSYLDRIYSIEDQNRIEDDVVEYRNDTGSFSREIAKMHVNRVLPLTWWEKFETLNVNLQKMAFSTLSQDCTSGAAERIWSMCGDIHTKKRNINEYQELEAIPTAETIEGPLEPNASTSLSLSESLPEQWDRFFPNNLNMGSSELSSVENHLSTPHHPASSWTSSVASPMLTPIRVVSPSSSSKVPLGPLQSLLVPSETHDFPNPSRATLLKPSFFVQPAPPSSTTPLPPPFVASSGAPLQPLIGAPLLQPFPPPVPSPSLTPSLASTPDPLISRDHLREALRRLVQNDHFIDLVFREVAMSKFRDT